MGVQLEEACASPPSVRWSSSRGCVRDIDGHHELWLGGTLAGRWNADDLGTRNVLLVGLALSDTIVLRDLARAFGVVFETLRLIRRQYEKDGLRAIVVRAPNRAGHAFKIDAKMRVRLETMFAAGNTIDQVFARVGRRWKLGHSTVGDATPDVADGALVDGSGDTPACPCPPDVPMGGSACPVAGQVCLWEGDCTGFNPHRAVCYGSRQWVITEGGCEWKGDKCNCTSP
jgi:hypothetical protein